MNVVATATASLFLGWAMSASGQDHPMSASTPLSQLLAEAESNNSQIAAADHEARALRHMVPQVTALPDPKLSYQQVNVGSPKPFAGYTNSDFSYVGLGGSQEFPYPGKLRLRGIAADREADAKQAEIGITKARMADAVKTDYLQLAFLQQTLGVLRENETVLDQLIQDVTVHYEAGQGMQQDILEAQVNRTKLVHEITMHHQRMSEIQAHLKGILHRDQTSPDLVAEELRETPLNSTAAPLLALVRQANPQTLADTKAVDQQDARIAAAKREGKPDFEIGYMYQNTDRKFRDYYMLSLNMSFPRRKRVAGQIAEAQERLAAARRTQDAHLDEELAEVQQQYARATSDERMLDELREGLIPQSAAVSHAALIAYASNREQFSRVLSYSLDMLKLKLEYAQTLLDHETALAHLESLTGATLR